MSQGHDVHECIDCGQPINIYKREQLLAGMCSKCVEKEKKIPIFEKCRYDKKTRAKLEELDKFAEGFK